MRVRHKKTIIEQLDDAIRNAAFNNKEIEAFELTENEFERLKEELFDYVVYPNFADLAEGIEVVYKGIPVEVE